MQANNADTAFENTSVPSTPVMQKTLISGWGRVLPVAFLLASCSVLRPGSEPEEVMEVELPEIEVVGETRPYRASNPRELDILHTRLDLSFDWKKTRVLGVAEIDAKPHFYQMSKAVLDAKGMDIQSVEVYKNGVLLPVSYDYDKSKLSVNLDKIYSRNEQFRLRIAYTGKPNELPAGGSAAIADNKGLYFINPDSTDKFKPTQIWTQGETEYNSSWFPTVDSPNERMTTEIFVSVPGKMTSLSNGDLIFSEHNSDGTRTDYWKMDQPHTPYLVMLAIGDFRVVKDYYTKKDGQKIEVSYYVEPEFEEHARAIFGATPEMIKVFSERLNYDYPWSKYSQVGVRDYVSGAMENTGAVIHGDFIYSTTRDLVDETHEGIIAHELFHHWFGDLVTCESWSNLPLNESFATYGEYLWDEAKHGRDEADYTGNGQLKGYLSESKFKKENLIRFHYDEHEDMFDSHSYSKGGRVLHMLRTHMGDEAFFAGLNKYLTDNAFKTVEIHQLRLAFEEVTGQDWNWFFNQWFLGKGHPELTIEHDYTPGAAVYNLTVTQTQDLEENGLFRLPLKVDVWTGRAMKRIDIDIEDVKTTVSIPVEEPPVLVNFDAEKILLGTKRDQMPEEMVKQKFYKATQFMDRMEAMEYATKKGDASFDPMIIAALADPHRKIREMAIDYAEKAGDRMPQAEFIIGTMAANDKESSVRAKAIKYLSKSVPENKHEKKFTAALRDSSYRVIGTALEALIKIRPEETLAEMKKLENEKSKSLTLIIANIYSDKGKEDNAGFFEKNAGKITGFEKLAYMQSYARFLKGKSHSAMRASLPAFENLARGSGPYWMKLVGYNSLNNLKTECVTRAAAGDAEKASFEALANDINTLIANIKKDETDPRLKGLGGVGNFEIKTE